MSGVPAKMKPRKNQLLKAFFITTSIGVVIHELAHKWAAEDIGLHIEEVDLFSLDGDSLGYVVHESPRTYRGWFAVSVAPFLLNSSISLVSFTGVGTYISRVGVTGVSEIGAILTILFTWLGVASALHAFPSGQDISNVENVKIDMWTKSAIPVVQSKFMGVFHRDTIYKILLSPVWIILRLLQAIVYTLRSPLSVVTLPFIIFLKICDNTRRYGSEPIYVVLLGFLSTLYIQYADIVFDYIYSIDVNIFTL